MYFVPPQKPRQRPPTPNLSNAFSPEGMLRPRDQQAPPMFGPRGATIPPRFLNDYIRPTNHYPGQFQQQYRPQQQWQRGGSTNRQPNWRPNGPNRQQSWDQNKEPGQFICEPCDRDFHTIELFEMHKSEHSICGLDGCTFSGHEKILREHIKNQHQTKLFDKLKNLNTPEEIELWRAERRKRFPTRENIELRQKAQEERTKRGEKLNEPKNRFASWVDRKLMEDARKEGAASAVELSSIQNPKKHENHKKDNKRNRNRQRGKKNGKGKPIIDGISKIITEPIENKIGIPGNENSVVEEEMCCGVKMFRGTSGLEKYKHLKKGGGQQNALGLLGVYGDDDMTDSGSEVDEMLVKAIPEPQPQTTRDGSSLSKPTSKDDESSQKSSQSYDVEDLPAYQENQNKTEHVENPCDIEVPTKFAEGFDSGNEAPIECPVDKAPANDVTTAEDSLKRPTSNKLLKQPPVKRIKSGLDYRKLKKNPQNTMLEKLLQSDIRHERNMVLQCVRHIVQNNFFGVGQEKTLP